jgi:hypothetical protein
MQCHFLWDTVLVVVGCTETGTTRLFMLKSCLEWTWHWPIHELASIYAISPVDADASSLQRLLNVNCRPFTVYSASSILLLENCKCGPWMSLKSSGLFFGTSSKNATVNHALGFKESELSVFCGVEILQVSCSVQPIVCWILHEFSRNLWYADQYRTHFFHYFKRALVNPFLFSSRLIPT